MKNIFKYVLSGAAAIAVASCNNNPKSPGYEYMPDMYNAVGYEANSANPNFKDSITEQPPEIGRAHV